MCTLAVDSVITSLRAMTLLDAVARRSIGTLLPLVRQRRGDIGARQLVRISNQWRGLRPVP